MQVGTHDGVHFPQFPFFTHDLHLSDHWVVAQIEVNCIDQTSGLGNFYQVLSFFKTDCQRLFTHYVLLCFQNCLCLAVMKEIRGTYMDDIDIILFEHVRKNICSRNAQLLCFFISELLVDFYKGDYFYIRYSSQCF